MGDSLCREDLDSELMMAAHSSCSRRSRAALFATRNDEEEDDEEEEEEEEGGGAAGEMDKRLVRVDRNSVCVYVCLSGTGGGDGVSPLLGRPQA